MNKTNRGALTPVRSQPQLGLVVWCGGGAQLRKSLSFSSTAAAAARRGGCEPSEPGVRHGMRPECAKSAPGVRQECARSAPGVSQGCAKPDLRGAPGVRLGYGASWSSGILILSASPPQPRRIPSIQPFAANQGAEFGEWWENIHAKHQPRTIFFQSTVPVFGISTHEMEMYKKC